MGRQYEQNKKKEKEELLVAHALTHTTPESSLALFYWLLGPLNTCICYIVCLLLKASHAIHPCYTDVLNKNIKIIVEVLSLYFLVSMSYFYEIFCFKVHLQLFICPIRLTRIIIRLLFDKSDITELNK